MVARAKVPKRLLQTGARAKAPARSALARPGQADPRTEHGSTPPPMFAKVNMGEWWRFVDRLLRLVTMDESVAYPAAFNLNQTFGSMALPGKEMKLS